MMTRITVDAALSSKLSEATEAVELCDSSGRVLGRFFPAPDLSQYEPDSLEPQVSDEELRRREQSEKWYTTEEVLDHLRKLEGR
jgi:hypothetical protein